MALGTQYNWRITLLVVLSTMMAALRGVIFGYDLEISGGVTSMEPFLEKFFPKVLAKLKEDVGISNYCKFDSQLLAFLLPSVHHTCLEPFLVGSALGSAASNICGLFFGRIFLGVGVGFANQVASSFPMKRPERCCNTYVEALMSKQNSMISLKKA